MDILMITHFTIFPWEFGNSRFVYLADLFSKKGNTVEIVTSSFDHSDKKQRTISDEQRKSFPHKITLLHEPGYRKNVCIKRLKSHKTLAKNLKKYLEKRRIPDVIYCSVPSLDVAACAADFCQKRRIRFIIDVQDLWPEAFRMALNIPVLSDLIFAPMKRKANKIYATADEIIGVSQTYCERALKANRKVRKTYPVFLGTDLNVFDNNVNDNQVEKLKEKFVIGYCGTLGNSYDLDSVIDAMELLKKQKIENLQLRLFGDGPLRQQFEEHAIRSRVDVVFYGLLSYPRMCAELAVCDATINSIRKGSAGSIINKHGDYAAVGLPVINTQESDEYRNLIERYGCGINCGCGDSASIAEAIRLLMTDENLCVRMGFNSRKMAEELFDRKATYQEIARVVCETNE